jgi:hypothetical protein
MRLLSFSILPVAAVALISLPGARSTGEHFRPVPQFVRGVSLRYRIETRTTSNEHTTTPIVNAEGASQYKQSTSLVFRLDVLDVGSQPQTSRQSVRFRASFEQARADSQADAYAPEAAALDDAMENLEGKSFEFSMDSGNKLTDVKGVDSIAANPDVASRVLSWVRVLCAPVEFPDDGIEISQKWTNERPLTDMPLTGITWQNESSYLRNEPCAESAGAKNAAASPFMEGGCALLLTRFRILRHGSEHSDATPEDYLRNGLRTSGKWTGNGESLDSLSLARGFLVASTQTATQDMDYEIRSASSGSRIHHVGQTTTQTEITLLPAQPSS